MGGWKMEREIRRKEIMDFFFYKKLGEILWGYFNSFTEFKKIHI